NSGTAGNPIVFEGYNGIPELDGQDQTGNGVFASSKDYIVLRNFKLTNYSRGARLESCENITLENIEIGITGSQGISLANSNYNTIQNCTMYNCNTHNIYFWSSHYNLVDNCNLIRVKDGIPIPSADYGMYAAYSHDNVIQNCYIKGGQAGDSNYHGHGIALRHECYNNKIINCEGHSLEEHFVIGEDGYDNEIINCVVYDDGSWRDFGRYTHGLVSRMGAHDNKFINCTTEDVRTGISLWTDGAQTQQNNIYENCIIKQGEQGIYLNSAANNTIKNCVITGSQNLFLLLGSDTGATNTLENSIITGVSNSVYGNPIQATVSYCDFWNNGFSALTGTGNISEDPLFANAGNGDFHLKSQYGRWNGSTWVNDSQTSSCIDAGNPSDAYSNEPSPNGSRINMGAYGNTVHASKSSGGAPPVNHDPIGTLDSADQTSITGWAYDQNAGTNPIDVHI
ncbi:right-handed parallel beta-helix repeat-containing protein, partial [bacterium]|nr:right-handed parallel beta-helix repeat-containing protein [bacterium]